MVRRNEVAEDILKEATEELKKLEKEFWSNRIYHFCEGGIWEPNPPQRELLDVWERKEKKVFTFTGANRLGKCLTYQTLIDTPSGKIAIGELFEKQEPFDVYAWDGRKKVIAKASAPFKKNGFHRCYRVLMKDGQELGIADRHRILTEAHGFLPMMDVIGSYSGSLIKVLDANKVESVKPISTCQEVYDFEVEKYHNYIAGDMVHHNTTIGMVILLSVMFGEWPWSGEKIKFSHKDPRKVRYIGQGWESHIKTVAEPELIKMWPLCRPVETKRNNQGVKAWWRDNATGSTLEVMSNNQESDTFEGWSGDLIVWDEPPKRVNRVAASRGLIDRQGKELFVATLLKEAWIHRDVIRARLSDGSPDTSVFNVYADIRANVGYGLTEEGVEQYKKTLRKDEIEARIHGKPSYLGNLVLPAFNRDKHVIDRFKIPLNWVVDISIDFHPSKPWAVLFVATAPNNMKYACEMINESGSPKYIAEEIIRIVKFKELFVNSISIDPLAKGDKNAHMEAETVYKIMERVFRSYNYRLETALKEKENGISLVNDLLMTENQMPALFFFKDLGPVIEQVEDWMFDPDTLKPSKEEDDFCEVLYRIALKNTQWRDPYDRMARLKRLPQADMGEVSFG